MHASQDDTSTSQGPRLSPNDAAAPEVFARLVVLVLEWPQPQQDQPKRGRRPRTRQGTDHEDVDELEDMTA